MKKGLIDITLSKAIAILLFLILAVIVVPKLFEILYSSVEEKGESHIESNLDNLIKIINKMEKGATNEIPHGFDIEQYNLYVYRICESGQKPPSCSMVKADICVVRKDNTPKYCNAIDSRLNFGHTRMIELLDDKISIENNDNLITISP